MLFLKREYHREYRKEEHTMKNNRSEYKGRFIAVFLVVVMLFLSGCSDEQASPVQTDPVKFRTGVDEGFDVIICMDESSSINAAECALRNQAASVLTQTITEDCRLGTVFFADNVKHEVDLLSLSQEENRGRFRELFDAEKGRLSTSDTGTNMTLALQKAFDFLGVSVREKAIILFTDGQNYISNGKGREDTEATEAENVRTRELVEKARTFDNGNPVPIYVVYLNREYQPGEGQTDEQVEKLLELFGTDGQRAAMIDACRADDDPKRNSAGWDDISWGDTATNKVIIVDEAKDLSEVFNKVFYKIKNISFKSFNAEPDSGGRSVVSFTVPDFGVSKIQITANSSESFSIGEALALDSGNVYTAQIGELAAGEAHVIDIVPADDTVPGKCVDAGMWQIELFGSKSVTGSVAVFADFSTEVSYEAQNSSDKALGCCQDMAVVIRLLNSSSEPISIPDGLNGSIVFPAANGGESKGYPLVSEDNALRCDSLKVVEPGVYNFNIILEYDKMNYSVGAQLEVEDLPPLVTKRSFAFDYTKKELMGEGYLDLGPVSDFVYDDHDGAALAVAMSEPCVISTYSEICPDTAAALSPEADVPHVFVEAGSVRKAEVAVNATDSSGQNIVDTINIKLHRVNKVSTALWISVSLALAALAILVFSKLGKYNRTENALRAIRCSYDAFIKLERNAGKQAGNDAGKQAEVYFCAVPRDEALFEARSAVVDVCDLKLTDPTGQSEDTTIGNGGLVLGLIKDAPVLCIDPVKTIVSSIKAGEIIEIFSRLTFVYSKESYGDVEEGRARSIGLEPDTFYKIIYNGCEFQLVICADSNWTEVLCGY